MDMKSVANELVTGCREGREVENLGKLYAADAVSVEAADMNGQGREAHGLDAIRGKHAWWDSAMEVTSVSVSDPMMHGDDRFAVVFEVEGKERATGTAFDMKEIAVYTVQDGKIVREEFFYSIEG